MNESQKIMFSELFKGHQLYFVGGAVRDSIMGISSNDIDLATDMTPQEMISKCAENNIKHWFTENSINHGTITIEGIEVTTFREDVSCDGRNAVTKWAKTIEEDLSRRDFTLNSIAKDFFSNKIVDPFNGIRDINNKVIRAVGNPEDRIREDTLRALRAIRFANKFGFEIEYNLFHAITKTDISNLSVERIREEFMKILETRNSKYFGSILLKVIPEFEVLNYLDGGDKHNETVDQHSIMTMQHIIKVSDNPLLIFAGLLHDIGKFYTKDDPERMFKGHEDIGAEKVREIMFRMKFSNEDIEYVTTLIKNHMRWHFLDNNFASPSDKTIRRAIRDIPDSFNKEQIISDLMVLTCADCQANLLNKPKIFDVYTERRGIYKRAIEILHKQPEVKIGSGLNLSGNDLIEMEFKPSPIFNTILKDVENKVFEKELDNENETLINYVKEKYGKKI